MRVGLVELGAVPLFGDTEVTDLGLSGRVYEDIARFEVSMQLALGIVQVAEASDNLSYERRYHKLWNQWHLIVILLWI